MTDDPYKDFVYHKWLGMLRYYEDGALLGGLRIDPSIRPPRDNGRTDAEVLLEFGSINPGPALDVKLDAVAARIKDALVRLPEIKTYGVDNGPSDWREYYEPRGMRPLVERLFLEGFEVNHTLDLTVTFDFEDLDMLLVHLDEHGKGRAVEVRP
jgi:hypothetical protein